MYMIGIDTGGTFTDMFAVDAARRSAATTSRSRRPISPRACSTGSAASPTGFDVSVESLLAGTEMFFFSTTMTTNLVVEDQGAEIGALTTIGHRDALHMMGGARGKTAGMHESDIKHSAMLDKPTPLVPKRRLREITERIDYAGRVVVPLDEAEVRAEVDALVAEGVEAIAICFLWAIRNPAHEQRVREIVEERHPDLASSLSLATSPRGSASTRASRRPRSTPSARRGSGATTAAWSSALEERGLPEPPLVMQATGGVATPRGGRVQAGADDRLRPGRRRRRLARLARRPSTATRT